MIRCKRIEKTRIVNNNKRKARKVHKKGENMIYQLKEKQGITLVALVITVIIMLILAGVAIRLTIGDNGIFKKAKEGSEIYENATGNEATSLGNMDNEMGNLMKQVEDGSIGGSGTPENKPNPDENGMYTKNSTINGEKATAFNPEIPKGFKPVNVDTANWGNGSTVPTEEAVKAGLIIEDAEGNQFVWIAVDGEVVKLNRYDFANDGTESELTRTDCLEEDATNTANLRKYGNMIARDINAFKESVAEHGGYYIARYEASYGVDAKPNSKKSTNLPIPTKGVAYTPIQEGTLWNNVTQREAGLICRAMYDNNYGITSDLMNSYAWDTAIVFIQK